MNFNETLLHKVLMIPIDNFKRVNIYSYILASPYFILLCVIGIPLAIICDIWAAIANTEI